MINRRAYFIAAALLAATAASGADSSNEQVETMIIDASGKNVGVARLTDTPNGVLIRVDFADLPPGEHAFHVHETGKCEPPFTSAGDHFNPGGKMHGFEHAGGFHAGDLPNIVVPASGAVRFEVFVPNIRLRDGAAKLLDEDGAALVVHAGVDDYATDPAGNAGDRIACGVIAGLEPVSVEGLKVAP